MFYLNFFKNYFPWILFVVLITLTFIGYATNYLNELMVSTFAIIFSLFIFLYREQKSEKKEIDNIKPLLDIQAMEEGLYMIRKVYRKSYFKPNFDIINISDFYVRNLEIKYHYNLVSWLDKSKRYMNKRADIHYTNGVLGLENVGYQNKDIKPTFKYKYLDKNTTKKVIFPILYRQLLRIYLEDIIKYKPDKNYENRFMSLYIEISFWDYKLIKRYKQFYKIDYNGTGYIEDMGNEPNKNSNYDLEFILEVIENEKKFNSIVNDFKYYDEDNKYFKEMSDYK